MENFIYNGINRLARRGGVTHMSKLVVEPVRDIMETYLRILTKYSVVYMDSQKKNTVQLSHVLQDLKEMVTIHYTSSRTVDGSLEANNLSRAG
jgi:histone H3/H4